MISGLIGSILENRKLKIIIGYSLISLILYFIWPAIINLMGGSVNPFVMFAIVAFFFASIGTSVGYLLRSGENNLWALYFIAYGIISLNSALIGTLFFYTIPNFSNMYVPLIYLAGYVINLILYFVFNMAIDRDPIGPAIVVFMGFIVISAIATFVALFIFNYPGIPLLSVE